MVFPGFPDRLAFFFRSNAVPWSSPVSPIGWPLAPPVVAAFRYPQCHERLPFVPEHGFNHSQDSGFLHSTHLPAPL